MISELLKHLDLVPFIQIPIKFKHKECFEEARQLLPFFIENTSDILTSSKANRGKWKSLALRAIDGDFCKTSYYTHYGEKNPCFQMTEIAERCPKIIAFLQSITDLQKCEAIRLMLLEPGGVVPVHTDARHLDVLPSVNIALNMPAGCDFIIDCRADGTRNRFTRKVPFKDGDLMLLNVAKYHYVINNSSLPRIHIMLSGLLKVSLEELLTFARTQNKLHSRKEVIQKLRKKYIGLGPGSLPQSVNYKLGFTMFEKANSPTRKKLPAYWVQGKELFRHLDLVPYLRIPGDFDYQGCYQEAFKLLSRFVAHPNNVLSETVESQGRWKSLALRALDGDEQKTLYQTHYHVKEPQYEMTKVASLCPKTITFLHGITDFDKCERIRFMLLEPGARIHVHSDARNLDVCPSVNIALNMPEGCRFVVDCNEDGSHHKFTCEVPFVAGDIMIVNIAKFHYVVNNSNVPRIHIIINGPVKFTPEELMLRARIQNQLDSEKKIIHELVKKYKAMGEGALPQSLQYKMGLHKDDPRANGFPYFGIV